jgi:aspartate aminotransferase, chloroplastic
VLSYVLICFRVKSQLKRIARPMYSNPPIHGARIVAHVVGNPEFFGEWKDEMEMMAGRIKSVRQKLYDNLISKEKSGKDWSFILKQIGMFSFTGLNKAQVIFAHCKYSVRLSVNFPHQDPTLERDIGFDDDEVFSRTCKNMLIISNTYIHFVFQSDNMTNKWHIYMTKDGRISLAGLSAAKCEYLADAIIDSYYNVS